MQTITKADLARRLAEETILTKTEAKQCVDVFFESMRESIRGSDKILLLENTELTRLRFRSITDRKALKGSIPRQNQFMAQ